MKAKTVRLLITGGTGLVGRKLAETAADAGHQVVVLSRSVQRATLVLPGSVTVLQGDPAQPGPWQEEAAACHAIVNLAGESLLAKRWNTDFKAVLHRSRVETTRRVAEVFSRKDCQAHVLVSASAVAYYGDSERVAFREDASSGSGFLAELCAEWEAEAGRAAEQGARVVTLRIGVVLARAGGVLAKMLPAFRRFLGGPIGSGRQIMSWIHVDDLAGLILHVLETESLSGPVNAAAPHPVTNREFSRTLGRVLGRPSFVRTPRFAIKCVLGEAAEVVLKGQRVLPAKAEQSGYRFKFPYLEAALRNLLSRPD